MRKAYLIAGFMPVIALSGCDVTSQSPVATEKVHISRNTTSELRSIIARFAEEHKLEVGLTEREQQFGPSFTFELTGGDIFLVVSNPFEANTFSVTGYAEITGAVPKAQLMVRSLTSVLANKHPAMPTTGREQPVS